MPWVATGLELAQDGLALAGQPALMLLTPTAPGSAMRHADAMAAAQVGRRYQAVRDLRGDPGQLTHLAKMTVAHGL